jgi:hypothetical protein
MAAISKHAGGSTATTRQSCRACADSTHMAMIAAVFHRVYFVRLLP